VSRTADPAAVVEVEGWSDHRAQQHVDVESSPLRHRVMNVVLVEIQENPMSPMHAFIHSLVHKHGQLTSTSTSTAACCFHRFSTDLKTRQKKTQRMFVVIYETNPEVPDKLSHPTPQAELKLAERRGDCGQQARLKKAVRAFNQTVTELERDLYQYRTHWRNNCIFFACIYSCLTRKEGAHHGLEEE